MHVRRRAATIHSVATFYEATRASNSCCKFVHMQSVSGVCQPYSKNCLPARGVIAQFIDNATIPLPFILSAWTIISDESDYSLQLLTSTLLLLLLLSSNIFSVDWCEFLLNIFCLCSHLIACSFPFACRSDKISGRWNNCCMLKNGYMTNNINI